MREGDAIRVWWCDPVGLLIQRLTKLRGAKKVYVIDKDARRLAIAKSFRIIPIHVSLHEDPAEYILAIEPHGLDRGIEASGFRSTNSAEHKAMRMDSLEGDSSDTVSVVIKSTRKCWNVALIGDVFCTTNDLPIGMMIEKSVTVRN